MSERDARIDVPTDVIGREEPKVGSRLLVTWNDGALARDLPEEGELCLGRGDAADVRIDATSVSRRHALLRVSQGELTIEDLGSANGTYVDGVRLVTNEPRAIAIGTLVELGSVLAVVRGYGLRVDETPAAMAIGPTLRDPEMLRVLQLVDLVARGKLSVLVFGETGTGKDVVAERVHAGSSRARAPFVRVSSRVGEGAIDAELFGTDARPGAVVQADGGTLFLDAVGELPVSTQAKLLHLLESGQVTRPSTEPRSVDVRLVCATSRDLKERIAAGAFRSDLYFRLDGFTINIPPLRARPLDIPPLAEWFAVEVCAREARAPVRFAESALARLVHHVWPGNVRELEHVVERSIVLSDRDVLHAEDIQLGNEPRPTAKSAAISATERARIVEALEKSAGNQTRAAKLLGVSRRTLLNRLSVLDLPRPRKPSS